MGIFVCGCVGGRVDVCGCVCGWVGVCVGVHGRIAHTCMNAAHARAHTQAHVLVHAHSPEPTMS